MSGLCSKHEVVNSEWIHVSNTSTVFFNYHLCLFVFHTNTIPVNRTTVLQIPVSKEMDLCKVGGQSIVVTVDHRSLLLQFKTPSGPCSPSLDQFTVQSFGRQCHARIARCSLLALQTWGASSSHWIHATTRSGEKVPQKATWGTGVPLQQQRPSTATMRATWWRLRVRCKPEQWKLW